MLPQAIEEDEEEKAIGKPGNIKEFDGLTAVSNPH